MQTTRKARSNSRRAPRPRTKVNGPGIASDLPHWDADRRELQVGSALVKRFRVPVSNQELILESFEEFA
jgi:hypothetical protein